MRKPYTVKHSDTELLCPDCGSKNIKLDDGVDVSTTNGLNLKQYCCEDCKAKFIPAIDGDVTSDKPKINEWSAKVRMTEGLNEGKSWKSAPKFIIIREKNK